MISFPPIIPAGNSFSITTILSDVSEILDNIELAIHTLSFPSRLEIGEDFKVLGKISS